jgi:hypothetical protein
MAEDIMTSDSLEWPDAMPERRQAKGQNARPWRFVQGGATAAPGPTPALSIMGHLE